MSKQDWLTPDPWEVGEPLHRVERGRLATAITDRELDNLRAGMRRISLMPVGEQQLRRETLARSYGVSLRTAYRYMARKRRCANPNCLTDVPGDRALCHFCRRSA